jgi:hypothetical protein
MQRTEPPLGESAAGHAALPAWLGGFGSVVRVGVPGTGACLARTNRGHD